MPDGLIASPHAQRQNWMSLLARATRVELETALAELAPRPGYTLLRPPEIGLAMVRGRAGGTGNPFNLGEMTMTRCAVRLDEAPHPVGHIVGLAYIVGRDARRAELAALFDALLQLSLQLPNQSTVISDGLLGDIRRRIETERRIRTAETAATRVDFFTLVREQGGE
jgi:alpha-D-ribose 1-methylphosphonate 5-triphosphate synthase subunit PhnG